MKLLQRSSARLAGALLLFAACAAPPRPVDARAAAWDTRPALAAFTARLEDAVAEGRLAGATWVVRHGADEVARGVVGFADREDLVPLRTDTVFRVFSMTKPVTSVAVLQLVERGALSLDDEVRAWFPELDGQRVLTAAGGEEPPARPLTVRDLLTHTSGFTYAFLAEPALAARYAAAGLDAPGVDAREQVRRLATLPLAFQPGTAWQYGRSTDVLGALVEAVTGERLDAYLAREVLGPLRMEHTGFVPAAADRAGRAKLYEADGAGGLRRVAWDEVDLAPTFCSGGGGLWSTTDDYLRFACMLANGGALDGARLLRAETVADMTRDHVAGLPRPRMLRDRGFGYGVAVLTEESASPQNGGLGGYHWSGMGGTSFFVDPANDLVAVFLVQAWSDFSWMVDFRKSVYAASREGAAQSPIDVGE